MAMSSFIAPEGDQHETYVDQDDLAYQDAITKKWYIFSVMSPWRIYWEMFVLVLACYNALMTPFEFSFEYVEARMSQPPFRQIEIIIDLFYLVDIIFGFTTSYLSPFNGDEFFHPGMIAKHYIKNDFIIDFLSTFWFYEFCKYIIRYESARLTFIFKIFKLLKVLRIRRISKLIRSSNSLIETKATLQVLYFTFCLVIYTHVLACWLWYLVKVDELWTPAVDFGSLQSPIFVGYSRSDKNTWSHFLYQYFTMWYNSCISFMMVEINMRSSQ